MLVLNTLPKDYRSIKDFRITTGPSISLNFKNTFNKYVVARLLQGQSVQTALHKVFDTLRKIWKTPNLQLQLSSMGVLSKM